MASKIGAYFANVFVANPDTSGPERLNALTKGILDLMRNCIIVGALQYFAKKTNSTPMDIIAVIGLCALFGYCISYKRFLFQPFHALTNEKRAKLFNNSADQILFLIFSFTVCYVVVAAVDELTSAQLR